MKLQKQNSRVSQSQMERGDVSIKAADVVFNCAFREVAAVKVSSSTAGIRPQATARLRSMKRSDKQLKCLTDPAKETIRVKAHDGKSRSFIRPAGVFYQSW